LPVSRTSSTGCPTECRGCAIETSPQVLGSGPLVGLDLALYSILTFLLPLVTTMAGAWWARHSPLWQLMGGILGLLSGMLIVRLCVLMRSRVRRGEP